MLTYITEKMPDHFWQLVTINNAQNNFVTDSEGRENDITIVIIRTRTLADARFFNRFPNLQVIFRAGSGYDNIDVKEAQKRNIRIATTPEANAQSAYEHTLMMIMACMKNLNIASRNMLNSNWKEGLAHNLEFKDLKVLVVGAGRIGSKVIKSLQFLGAEVNAVDPYLTKSEWDKLGVDSCAYDEGLNWCNLVTYHCPLTDETYHYFGQKQLDQIKNPIYIVNVARGGIVDESIILPGLNSGIINGVALDVFEIEPNNAEQFDKDKRIILTPHTGAYTQKAKYRLAQQCWILWKDFVERGLLFTEIDYRFVFSLKKN